jgi:hypothetical protein
MIYVVSGSREFPDMDFVRDYMWQTIEGYDTLIHGGARGVDQKCAAMAKGCGADVVEVPAQWEKFGKKAGPIRNGEMIASTYQHQQLGNKVMALIFWDGKSKGTANFMYQLKQTEIPYKLFTLEVRS